VNLKFSTQRTRRVAEESRRETTDSQSEISDIKSALSISLFIESLPQGKKRRDE
jgi:hypothetical protein